SFASTAGAMSYGREWSFAGRQRTVTFSQPFRSMIARTLLAIAPHASTSTSGRSASKTRSSSGRRSCCTAGHDESLGGLGGDGCVAAVRVCADRLAELLVQGSPSDEDDVVVPDAFLLERVDDDLHVGHRRREQSGHAE